MRKTKIQILLYFYYLCDLASYLIFLKLPVITGQPYLYILLLGLDTVYQMSGFQSELMFSLYVPEVFS
jgi:hypothetical protein